MGALFHIIERSAWRDALAQGEYRPESLRSEGFIHCSFAAQVAGVANALYRDVENLLVVELDSARIDAAIRVEDSYGSGQAFPHVYGAIPVAAAVATHELTTDAVGDYGFSVCGATGAASPDR